MDAEELLNRYAAGERDFTGVSLKGINLSGVNIRDSKLDCADLRAANLSGAKTLFLKVLC